MSAAVSEACSSLCFSLLQRDPKLPLSCYFFQGQTDAFVETFKFPLGKGKKHCDLCLLNSSIFNLPPLNISQHNLNSETLTLAGWWKEKVRRQTDPRLGENCTISNQYRERSDCFETRWSLFGLGQEAWKKGRLAPNGLGAGPTGEEEGGCLPLKNYGETQSLFPPRQSWFEESFKGFVCGRGFKLGGAGSLVADETDAPEGIAGPHLLTSSQLPSETAWKATIALFE